MNHGWLNIKHEHFGQAFTRSQQDIHPGDISQKALEGPCVGKGRKVFAMDTALPWRRTHPMTSNLLYYAFCWVSCLVHLINSTKSYTSLWTLWLCAYNCRKKLPDFLQQKTCQAPIWKKSSVIAILTLPILNGSLGFSLRERVRVVSRLHVNSRDWDSQLMLIEDIVERVSISREKKIPRGKWDV